MINVILNSKFSLFMLMYISFSIAHAEPSNPCEEGTAAGLRKCADASLKSAEPRMKSEYKKLLSVLPKSKQYSQETWEVTKSELIEAQAAWIKSVSLNCSITVSFPSPDWRWGSDQYDLCLAHHYDSRAQELKRGRLCVTEGGGKYCGP